MQISLRSHLIAGVAAAVGASTIAMTPALQADVQLPALHMPSVQQIALTGFDNPISELLLSLGAANAYTFLDVAPPVPGLLGPLPAPWTGSLSKVGLIPQIITDGLPIISQLGINGSDYLYNSVKGLGSSAYVLNEGVWNAAGYLLALNLPAAVNELTVAIQTAGQTALDSGVYVATGVITRALAVVNAVAGLVPDLIQAGINQPLVVLGSLIQTAQNTVAALSSANPIEGAWNAAVDGLFGPTGLPGVMTALTVGAGVAAPAPISGFVPSIRTEISTVVQTIKGALATPNPAPTPAAAPQQTLASARNAAAVATEEEQSSTGTDSDAPDVTAPVRSGFKASESHATAGAGSSSSSPKSKKAGNASARKASANASSGAGD